MKDLNKRLQALEATHTREPGRCFWCECEQDGTGKAKPCSHRQWPRISHEAALAELAGGGTNEGS